METNNTTPHFSSPSCLIPHSYGNASIESVGLMQTKPKRMKMKALEWLKGRGQRKAMMPKGSRDVAKAQTRADGDAECRMHNAACLCAGAL